MLTELTMRNLIGPIVLLAAAMPAAATAATATQGSAMERTNPQPPRLIAFDEFNLLARAASRQRILSQELSFRIDVDAQGIPTQCETKRKFRRAATQIDLCRPILKYSRFEPATDRMGNPTAGRYVMDIDFNSPIARRGS